MTKKEIIQYQLFRPGVDSNSYFHEFLNIAHLHNGKYYWYALNLAYTSSDNLYIYKEEIKKAFLAKRTNRESIMDEGDLKIYQNLPNEVTIFRGMTLEEKLSGDFGISWSLKESVANFFAFEYTRNTSTQHMPRVVHKLVVKKKDIIAYFNERKEHEIIYIPLT